MSGGNFNAQHVANAFVEQYYSFLHDCPEAVHKFYQESSLLGWPGADDTITSVTTLQGINDKIVTSVYKDWSVEIKTVDAQESMDGGVFVAVTGCFTIEDNMKKNFSQSFFLAKQEKGFFVLNDILRFIDVCKPLPGAASHNTEDDQAAPRHDLEPANIPDDPLQESASMHAEAAVEDGSVNEALGPSIINDTAAGVAVSKPSVPSQENVHAIVESSIETKEEAKKISYAAMVSKANSSISPTQAPACICVRVSANANQQPIAPPVPKAPTARGDGASKVSSHNNHTSKAPTLPSNVAPKVSSSIGAPNASNHAEGNDGASKVSSHSNHTSKASTLSSDVAPKVSNSIGATNASNHAEARGIYIGGLPYNITKHALIEAIKKFGQVRRIPNCVQIRKHEDGFCCGFVEFEHPESARHAVEAHRVLFGDKEAYITYKRSSNQGGSRERPSQNGSYRRREDAEDTDRSFQSGNRAGFGTVKSAQFRRKASQNGDEVAASKGGAN